LLKDSGWNDFFGKDISMGRKPNYGFEKRQKELARKAKKEEKRKRKQGEDEDSEEEKDS
jgi:hypothetical protein